MSEEFTVKDRRLFTKDGRLNEETRTESGEEGAARDGRPGEEARKETQTGGGPGPLPPPTFPSLILGLATSALIHLGESPEPGAAAPAPDLAAAKQAIDLLGILKDKTRGNLEREEEALLETLLYDLRLKYVKASQ